MIHIYAYIHIYMFMQDAYWRNNNRRAMTSLKKYTSHFICNVCMWEGVGDQTELQYIDPHSYGRQRCVFLVLQVCSTGVPGAQLSVGWWLSLPHLITNWSPNYWGLRGPRRPGMAFPTTSYQQLLWTLTQSGASRAPSAGRWFSLPQHVSVLSCPKLTDFLSSLSYVIVQSPTQSPTQSLEWHVWSSSSRNNCHAFQRSLSSGASVYECTMGFFTLSHFVSQERLRDFLS